MPKRMYIKLHEAHLPYNYDFYVFMDGDTLNAHLKNSEGDFIFDIVLDDLSIKPFVFLQEDQYVPAEVMFKMMSELEEVFENEECYALAYLLTNRQTLNTDEAIATLENPARIEELHEGMRSLGYCVGVDDIHTLIPHVVDTLTTSDLYREK